MPNTVIALKKSAIPTAAPTNLANGELAINYADGILYYKAANGTIASIQSLEGNSFGTVNANGTLLVSDTVGDFLTMVSGNNISIIGDAVNDKLTVALTNDVTVPGKVTVGGNFTHTGGDFFINNMSGAGGSSEGGEIKLANATQNQVLSGPISIDIFENRLRFFETNSPNRGAFINLAACGTVVGTDLLAASTGTDVSARITANQAFDKANAALPNVSGASFNGNLTVSQNLTSDRVFTLNNGNGENFKVGDDAWFGDTNLVNTVRLKGQQNASIGYIIFGPNDGKLLGRDGTGPLTYDGGTVWHSNNDGAGSGLDADFLDGQHGSYYGIASDVTAANRVANSAFLHANAAFVTVNSAFNRANTALPNTSGVSFNGNLNFPSGNVGIGTAAPAQKLDVTNGNIVVSNGYGYKWGTGSAFIDGSSATSTNYISIGTNNNSRLYIDHNGNVGIGTSAPSYKLHVQGTGLATTDFRAPIFYDSDNTGYYVDPNSTSNINQINVAGYNLQSSQTIDLTALDQSTYYPVSISIPSDKMVKIRINVGLNSSSVPSWSTHPSGFDLVMDWDTVGSGWGTTTVQRNINAFTYGWSSVNPCGGIAQIGQSSLEIVYLRGGGRYFIEVKNHHSTISPNPTGITSNGVTYNPITTILNDIWSSATGSGTSVYSTRVQQGVYTPALYDLNNTSYYLAPSNATFSAILSGNVGIGTISPTYKLQVQGGIYSAGDNSSMAFYSGTTGLLRQTLSGGSAYIDIATGSAAHGNLIIRSSNAGTTRFLIDNNGNVIIGRGTSTVGSGVKLDIAGAANASNLLVNGNMVFHTANDGAGSNLDADFLDGQHGSYYGIASDVAAAFTVANNALPRTGGTVTGNLAITGSLTVQGNVYLQDTVTIEVSDPLLYLAGNNYTSDIVDIGFVANYVNATGQNVHTGLFRDATIKEYYLFEGYDKEPDPNHIDTAGNNFTISVLNATLKTSNLILGGTNTIPWITAAFVHANAAHASANAGMAIANGAFASANAAQATANAAFNRANTANITADRAWNHANAAFATVNSAFGVANTALPNTSGVSFVGNLNFPAGNVGIGTTTNVPLTVAAKPAGPNVAIRVVSDTTPGSYYAELRKNDGITTLYASDDLTFRTPYRITHSAGGGGWQAPHTITTASAMTYAADGAGTQFITFSGTFQPVTGNGWYKHFYINPTINQAANTLGDYTIIHGYVNETSARGTNNKLIDMGIGTTAKFSVSNTGKGYFADSVGIGTASPSYKLDVNGAINTSADLISQGTDARISLYRSSGINYFDWSSGQSLYFSTQTSAGGAGRDTKMILDASGNVGIGTTSPSYKLQVNGSFAATTKSFVIDHPTKPGMKLRYGSLEGPENGVYVRGRSNTDTIVLPDYWSGLVDEDTVTVNITPIGKKQSLYVKEANSTTVVVGGGKNMDYYFTVFGERKDVDKLVVEY